MTAACIGGTARKLIDARFVRALNLRERGRLEQHLAGCAACGERYRRLHFAERVAAVGEQDAFDVPSAAEIDRIAGDLGLIEGPRRWRPEFSGRFFAVAASVAVTLTAAAIFVMPQTETPLLVERGGTVAALSFSLYAIGSDGSVRALTDGGVVRATDHLKLRASWADGNAYPLTEVSVRLDGAGDARTVVLGGAGGAAPSGPVVSVPGAIALAGVAGFEPGPLVVTVEADGAHQSFTLELKAAR